MQQMVHEISVAVSGFDSSLRFFELPGPPSAASPSAGGEPAPSPARRARIRSCTSAERNTEPYSDHPRAASDAPAAWDATSAQRAWWTAVEEGLLPLVLEVLYVVWPSWLRCLFDFRTETRSDVNPVTDPSPRKALDSSSG